jgi:hypothetical protein
LDTRLRLILKISASRFRLSVKVPIIIESCYSDLVLKEVSYRKNMTIIGFSKA